jgi:hypothetical protein
MTASSNDQRYVSMSGANQNINQKNMVSPQMMEYKINEINDLEKQLQLFN